MRPTTTEAAPAMQTPEHFAQRYLAAWTDHDLDRIMSLHTTDTVFHMHAGGQRAVGQGAVREAFEAIFATWLDFRFETNRLRVGEEHWVLDWTLAARPASGGDGVRLGCLDFVTFNEQRLVRTKDTYVDATDVAAVAS